MQDLLKFIVRYSNFLVLLGLEVVAFLLIVNFNEYPRYHALSTANTVVAAQYKMVNDVEDYFSLDSQNQLLSQENAELRNRIAILEDWVKDSLCLAESRYLKGSLNYIPARVIQLDTRSTRNYLTLDKGTRDGVTVGMGVQCPMGVVGQVRSVSEHYAVVIPVIHVKSQLSCQFLKNGYAATLSWNGVNYRYADLNDVACHMEVEVGDTLVTSGLTAAFPQGIAVGVVDKCELGSGDSYYTIRVQLSTDFRQLNYVQIIDNRDANELNKLVDELD